MTVSQMRIGELKFVQPRRLTTHPADFQCVREARVVRIAVRAPFPVSKAFRPTVVPCPKRSISEHNPSNDSS